MGPTGLNPSRAGMHEKRKAEEEEGLIQSRGDDWRYGRTCTKGYTVLQCLLAWALANPRRFILGTLAAASLFALGLFKLLYHPPAPPSPWRAQCRSDFPTYFAYKHVFPSNSWGLTNDLDEVMLDQTHNESPHQFNFITPLSPSHSAWPFAGAEAPNLADADALTPVGVLVGVFAMDKDAERRSLIRDTYGSHPESRKLGTEGVKVVFVMGRPSPEYAAKVALEAELYGDLVILDIEENMNDGKTHAYFAWAAEHARVPKCEYPGHASHSSKQVGGTTAVRAPAGAVCQGTRQPDYVVKADDDSFIVLAELERRLRIAPRERAYWGLLMYGNYLQFEETREYMAGEGYGLSMDLVKFVATSPWALENTIGHEDRQVANWLRAHPISDEITWISERCWMYDHPKAGKLLSHGFMFPDVVQSIRANSDHFLPPRLPPHIADTWSTVSPYNRPYEPPVANLTIPQQLEALVEGSPMSMYHKHNRRYFELAHKVSASLARAVGTAVGVEKAWESRPTRDERMKGWESGSTVLIHKVRKDEWWMETALALLGPRPR